MDTESSSNDCFLQGEQLKRRTSEKVANDQLFASAAFDRYKSGVIMHTDVLFVR
jgi:hypothetical protein